MALSQIQCLDDNHVNPRTHESKPEFLYCEEQRHALETLLRDGREAFFKQLEERGLRGFLSDLELEALAGTVEPYDPGVDLYREDPESEDHQTPLSLHYWPELSDMTIPELDMGWPDSEAYRGVTRTTVYTQPPLEGQTHIKEVIRKMIAQAQKVIAVVMDVFTDVDIFRDLLEISFKKKVSVYILLDRASVPHFLSMVQRANMHIGHLKNLRVRCSGGTEFYTHSCTKVRGHMGHRFMFIDGDKAVSGSYSFTWMSARLDRNLITVVTGQAVEAFDRLFRFLYTSSSRLVNLQRVVTEPEPEPDPVPQPASVPTPSAAIARKLYNPKYALVAVGNASLSPSSSAGNNSPKESQKDAKNEATKKGRRKKSKDTYHEAPPLHPGLVDLEKVYLFDYLPIWPEPDPSSDVIGFINIRDTSKPNQVHRQRSEMFEVSQAIRFSSPFNVQKEALPEVAKPRNLSALKHDENSAQPQQKTQLDAITPETKTLTQSVFDKENAKAPGRKTPQSPVSKIHNTTPDLHTPPPPVKTVTTPTTSAYSPKTAAKTNTQTTTLNSKSALQNTNALEMDHAPKVLAPSDSNSQIKTQKHNSNENTSPAGYIPVTSTSASANYQVSQATTAHSTLTSTSPALAAISTSASNLNTNPPLAPSPITSPPIPKPRTVQLVIKDSPSDGQKIPEVCLVKKQDRGGKVTTVDNETPVAVALTPKETEKVPELANKSGSKWIQPKSTEDTAVKNRSQEKESKNSPEVGSIDAENKAESQLLASSKKMEKTNTEVSKVLIKPNVNKDKDILKKNEGIINLPKGSSDFLENKPEGILIRNSDVAKVQNQTGNKVGQSSHAKVSLPQRTYSTLEENRDLLNSPTNISPVLKMKSESIPTIKVEAQGDVLKVDESVTRTVKSNNHSPLPSPKVPKKPAHLQLNIAQTTDVITFDKESGTRTTYSTSEENKDLLKSPTNRSPILKTKPESIPIIKGEAQGDILKFNESVTSAAKPNSHSPLPSPKVPKKPAHLQQTDSTTSDQESLPRISSSAENINLLHSPTNRSPVLKKKSENTPIIAAETQGDILKVNKSAERTAKFNNRSPLQSPKVPKKTAHLLLNISQTTDLIIFNNESQTRTAYSSSEENINTLHSPTNRSPIVKTKSENIPTITTDAQGDMSKADGSLARTAKSNNCSPLPSPKVSKKPAHLLLNISQSSEENINLFNFPNNRSPVLKKKSENTNATEMQGDISKVDETLAKFNNRSPLLSPRVPKKTAQLHLNASQTTDSTTSEKESRSLLAQRNSPILDGFPLRIPTPDSRRSRTPEFRTPTSDISDGCGSTTSDEFYECNDTPFHESIDQVPFYSLNPLKDKDTVVNSCVSYKEQAAMLNNDRTMSSSETLNLSNKGSLSSILEKMDGEEKLTKENMQEREAIRKRDDKLEFQELVNQAKSNLALNQSAMVEQSLTPKLNNEAKETKWIPARELKPKKVYSRAEKPDKVPVGGEKTGFSTSGVERREAAPTANKEPEGPKQQQRDSTAQVQTRLTQSTRSSRPLSATQSTLVRPMSHQRKMSDGNLPILDFSSSPTSRKVPPRPPAPKAIPNQHYRQPPTLPAKPKLGQTPNLSPLPKPQPSFLYTHAQNMQQRPLSSSQLSQEGPIPVGQDLEAEKTAFGITFSKLYNLKGLKDKMSKLPTQNRRSSTSGSVQQRKSTG